MRRSLPAAFRRPIESLPSLYPRNLDACLATQVYGCLIHRHFFDRRPKLYLVSSETALETLTNSSRHIYRERSAMRRTGTMHRAWTSALIARRALRGEPKQLQHLGHWHARLDRTVIDARHDNSPIVRSRNREEEVYSASCSAIVPCKKAVHALCSWMRLISSRFVFSGMGNPRERRANPICPTRPPMRRRNSCTST